MAELDDALAILASWFDQRHVPYMVIGGFAITVWGEPRFTRDIDVSISVPADQLDSTIQSLCSEFVSLVSDPPRFVAETRVLPVMVGSVPADIVFAALPYED